MSGQPRWVCAQLGSREHYAIPRALHRARALEALLTDFWAKPRWLWKSLPSRRMASARERWHPELADARVHGLGWKRLSFDASNRGGGWETILRRNEWFQRRHIAWLQANKRSLEALPPGIFFAYSYAARDLFQFFKELNWKTVLGQIDPGPREEVIVESEAKRFPKWRGAWNPAPQQYWLHWREELGLADRIVVNSDWSLECLRAEGVPEEKLVVVPLAYESAKLENAEGTAAPEDFTASRPMRVLFLGQVNLRKGAHHLLEAARRLEHLPVEFDFVGPVEISLPSDLPANVRFHGPVSREMTAKYYASADVFALPTLSDGFALTQLEALARGIPVMVTRNCGRVVEDRRNGWILDAPTSEAIAKVVTRLAGSPGEVASCKAGANLSEAYSMAALGKALETLGQSFK